MLQLMKILLFLQLYMCSSHPTTKNHYNYNTICNEVTEMSLVLHCFVVDTSQDTLCVTSGDTKEGEEQSVQQSLLFISCY